MDIAGLLEAAMQLQGSLAFYCLLILYFNTIANLDEFSEAPLGEAQRVLQRGDTGCPNNETSPLNCSDDFAFFNVSATENKTHLRAKRTDSTAKPSLVVRPPTRAGAISIPVIRL